MKEYHKINAPFKRDMAGDKSLIIGDWAQPEFEFLQDNKWEFTEKVDGTNIRIHFGQVSGGSMDGGVYFKRPSVGGRTDNANIPEHLKTALSDLFRPAVPAMHKMVKSRDLWDVTLYGEGYGPKIQGGGKYREDASFVLFDVLIGDTWLERENVNDVANTLGIYSVPVIGHGTLHDAIDIVKNNMLSTWGNFEAEGIVARPKVSLFDRQGRRVITKIKGKDFRS